MDVLVCFHDVPPCRGWSLLITVLPPFDRGNYFAWILRSLVVNEYQSGKYDYVPPGADQSVGEQVLTLFGFTLNGEPFGFEWVWYGLACAVGVALLSVVISTFFLSKWRFETGKALGTDIPDVPNEFEGEDVAIPFQKTNLTFKDIHYTVKASTTDEYLEILKGIDGYIEAGKMTVRFLCVFHGCFWMCLLVS